MPYGCFQFHKMPRICLTTTAIARRVVQTPVSSLIPAGKWNCRTIMTNKASCATKKSKLRNVIFSGNCISRHYSEKVEASESLSFIEKMRQFWRGPTFKYWFIGVTGFSTWLAYYSLNTYKKTRININLPLILPNHLIIERDNEMASVFECIGDAVSIGSKVKCVAICGPSGSGKSLVAKSVTERLMHEIDWNPLGLPKSHISVFLNGANLRNFYLSLQGFAARMKIRPSEIKEKLDASTDPHCYVARCKAILEVLKEKLQKHPNWVFVVDNLQQGTSEEVAAILKDSFLDESVADSWSKGILILTSDGLNLDHIKGIKQFKMEPRLSDADATKLLKDIIKIEDASFETSPATKSLLKRIAYHPMTTVCAAILLKNRLEHKEIKSIDSLLRELVIDIAKHGAQVMKDSPVGPKDGVAESLVIAETVIAMSLKMLLTSQPHLSAAVDLISACSPRTPIPSVFISRYFTHSSLHLPALEKPVSTHGNLQQMFKAGSGTQDESLEPKGKAWSNKSITEYVTSVEEWFSEIWQALKEVYNFYYGKIPEPDVDNSIKILHDCELLLSSKLQPGEVESYAMHPLIYAVARQHFLSRSVPQVEASFLHEDEERFNKQPWFKKMSKYDPKTSLFQYRNGMSKEDVDSAQAVQLAQLYNNALIDVSCALKEPSLQFDDSDYRFLNAETKVKHLQCHLNRIIGSLSEEVRVSKQTISGKTATKYLSIHADYLRENHPPETFGTAAMINGMLTAAKIKSNFENNLDSAIADIEQALQLIRASGPENSLERASILCQLAAMYNSREDHENAKDTLEEAIEIYESQRRKDGEYKRPLELGKALGALGVIKGTLGDRAKSKELIERGLMLQQTGAPDLADEAQSKHFGGEFASSLTDLGHAYVSLGMPLYGKKILDLSLMAHKNIHGEKHPEVIRTLTVLSVAHLMQGHNEESKKLRKEAGKLQAQLNALPMY